MSETLRETIEKAFAEHMHYYELYAEESDRGAAVLAHALFDHRLGNVLKSRNDGFKKGRLQIWMKVEIAYALRLFDQETRAGLSTINRIRNKFAHSFKQMDLRDKEVAALCSKLKTGPTPTDPRERYLTYLRDVERRF